MDFRRGRTSENPPVWKPHLSVPESSDTSTMTFGALTFFLSSVRYAAVKVIAMLFLSSRKGQAYVPERAVTCEGVRKLLVRAHEINVVRIIRYLPRYEQVLKAVGVPPRFNLSIKSRVRVVEPEVFFPLRILSMNACIISAIA